MLEEFSPDRRVVMVANTNYTGTLKPMTDKLVVQHRHRRQRLRALPGRRDRQRRQRRSVGDVKTVLADPALKAQFFVNPGDFRSYYVFFDITKAPFDDQKVRLAFAKAIDREAIVAGILAPDGDPGLLLADARLPGRERGRASSPIQAFDADAAKQLLADAGFPDGKGFPPQTLDHPWRRAGLDPGRHPGGRRQHHPDARRPDRPADHGPGAVHGPSC